MPVFRYTAQDAEGKRCKGRAVAVNSDDLHILLRERGLFLLSCRESAGEKPGKQLKSRQLAEFCRQLGVLLGSGVPLGRALSIICQQEELSRNEKRVFAEIMQSVRTGLPLSEAMELQNGVFPAMLSNLFRSAETSGTLDKVAMQMADHYDKQWRMSTKVRNAMQYPKILTGLIVAVVCIIMTFVLPRFDEIFSEMDRLPLITVILFTISGFLVRYWYAAAACAVLLILIFRWMAETPSVRIKLDEFILSVPRFGAMEKMLCSSRFARTLASLYCSGLPIVSCLEIARHTVGNLYIDSQFDEVIVHVRSGGSLSDALGEVNGLVKRLKFSVRVGEETGELGKMLESTADAMEYESEMALQRMVGMLEPAMIVIMALIVGFVMLAVMIPIYSMYNTIGAM